MKKYLIIFPIIIFIFFVNIGIRYILYQNAVIYRYSYEYIRESALFIHFAKKIIKGESLSEKDKMIKEYDDYVVPDKVFTLFSLKILIKIYKFFELFRKIIIEKYLSYSGILVVSITSVFIFLIVFEITKAILPSFWSGLAFAVLPGSLLRTICVDFTKEVYSLPFIFASVYFFLKYINKNKLHNLIFSSICFGVSVLIWDMARLFFLVFDFSMLLAVLFLKDENYYRKVLVYFVVKAFFADLMLIFDNYFVTHKFYLFEYNYFAVSSIFAWIASKRGVSKRYLKLIFFLVLFSCFSVFFIYNKDYSHFGNLLFYKLIYLNKKPVEPYKLPFEARLLWSPALHSLSLKNFLYYYMVLIILSMPVYILQIIKKTGEKFFKYSLNLMLIGIILMFLSFLFFRVIIFSVPILIILSGISMFGIEFKYKKLKYFVFLIYFVLILVESNKIFSAQFGSNYALKFYEVSDRIRLERWISQYLPKKAEIIGNFTLMPSVVSYAGRPVISHPKYENKESRMLIEEYIKALFSEKGEKMFYKFCLDRGADYFVFSRGTFLDRSLYSYRYMAGYDGSENSGKKVPAYLFENMPYETKYFGLVYKGPKYYVFRIISKKSILLSSMYFKKAVKMLSKDGNTIKAYRFLYKAYLYNPHNIAVKIMLVGLKNKINCEFPDVY